MISRRFLLPLPFALALAANAPAFAETAAEDGSGEMFIGKPDAPITMVAYLSLFCPHCAAFHAEKLPQLRAQYVDPGYLKIAFREFPGSREEPWPRVPAMMARCLGPQQYHGMMDRLFKDQEKWLKADTAQQFLDNIAAYGQSAGMSRDQFDACLRNEKILRGMDQRWREGKIEQFPTVVVEGRQVVGNVPMAEFDAVLKPLVEKLSKK